jgi:nitroreductase
MKRHANYPIEPLILNRWSPRAFAADEIPEHTLMTLFEAARWAPSSNNNQPWRFVYAKRGGRGWDRLLNLLVPNNKSWCEKAAALVVVVSKTTFDFNGTPSITHSYDAGAAWQTLALQATAIGWAAHGMQGFDYKRAQTELRIPADFNVEAMIAIGKPGDPAQLPEKLREREFPNDRKELQNLVFEATFGS